MIPLIFDLINFIFIFFGTIISGIIANIYAYKIGKRHLTIINKAMGVPTLDFYNVFSVFRYSEKILYAYKPEYAKNHYKYKSIYFSKISEETRIICKKFIISSRIMFTFTALAALDAYFLMGLKINIFYTSRIILIISGAATLVFWSIGYLFGIYIIKKHMRYIEAGFNQTPGKYFRDYASALSGSIGRPLIFCTKNLKEATQKKNVLRNFDFTALPKKTITACKISFYIGGFFLLSAITFLISVVCDNWMH